MWDHPDVRAEANMSNLQWLTKRLSHDSWGGDLEVRLMTIGLHRDIVAVTVLCDGSTFA